MLLAVGRDLLDTRLVVQAPQTQRAVVACAGAGAGGAVAQQLRVPSSPAPAQTCLPEPASLETAEPPWAILLSGQCLLFIPLGSFWPFSMRPSPSHAMRSSHWGLVSLSTNGRCPTAKSPVFGRGLGVRQAWTSIPATRWAFVTK